MKKILSLLTVISFMVYGNTKLYNEAIADYNNKNYAEAQKKLLTLEESNYANTYIYFVLGKLYKNKQDYTNATIYLEKYLENPSSKKNEVLAKVNLAYVHLKMNKYDEAVKLVDPLIKTHKNLKDVTLAYATVYNAYGYYLLYKDKEKNMDNYRVAETYFNKALKTRKELVGVANNLLVTYFKFIFYAKDKEEFEAYIKKADKLLSNPYYKKFKNSNMEKNRLLFYDFIVNMRKVKQIADKLEQMKTK